MVIASSARPATRSFCASSTAPRSTATSRSSSTRSSNSVPRNRFGLGASTVLIGAGALFGGQLALMVGYPLGALNPFGVSLLPHLGRMFLVKAGRLLV